MRQCPSFASHKMREPHSFSTHIKKRGRNVKIFTIRYYFCRRFAAIARESLRLTRSPVYLVAAQKESLAIEITRLLVRKSGREGGRCVTPLIPFPTV